MSNMSTRSPVVTKPATPVMSSTRTVTARMPGSIKFESDPRPSLPESFDNRIGSFCVKAERTTRFSPFVTSEIDFIAPVGNALLGQSTSCSMSAVISVPYFKASFATTILVVSMLGACCTAVSATGAATGVWLLIQRSAAKIESPPKTTASPTIGTILPFTKYPCPKRIFCFCPQWVQNLKKMNNAGAISDNLIHMVSHWFPETTEA